MLLYITRQTPLLPQTTSETKRNNLVNASDSASTNRGLLKDNSCCSNCRLMYAPAQPDNQSVMPILALYSCCYNSHVSNADQNSGSHASTSMLMPLPVGRLARCTAVAALATSTCLAGSCCLTHSCKFLTAWVVAHHCQWRSCC
jgi:hypothetical protein